MDKFLVTVARFRVFIRDTGYVSDAEKFGDAGIFDFHCMQWMLVRGATWEYLLVHRNKLPKTTIRQRK